MIGQDIAVFRNDEPRTQRLGITTPTLEFVLFEELVEQLPERRALG
jgi:hypothetical protein